MAWLLSRTAAIGQILNRKHPDISSRLSSYPLTRPYLQQKSLVCCISSSDGNNVQHSKRIIRRRRKRNVGVHSSQTKPIVPTLATTAGYRSSNVWVPSDRGNISPIPETNMGVFLSAASALFVRIEIALNPLLPPTNDHIEIERNDSANGGCSLLVHLGPLDGSYSLSVDTERCVVELKSPISGAYTYVLDQNSGEFLEETEGHSLVGLMTRDLIRQIRGCPNF